MDPRVVVENMPSEFMGAEMQNELQRNQDMEALYDFIYDDGYDSGHTGLGEGADDNEVIMDAVPRDSALTQTLGIVFSGPEYRFADEDGVCGGENMLRGDIWSLQIPARLPEEGGGFDVPIYAMSATSAGHVCGKGDIPIEERLKYALLAHQKQRLEQSRVALQLHTEKLMKKITCEEQARTECFFQMQCLRELGRATYRGPAFREQLKVAEDAHIVMVEAESQRYGAWLLQQELKWSIEEEELALLLLKNNL